jgi:hypothetical protein
MIVIPWIFFAIGLVLSIIGLCNLRSSPKAPQVRRWVCPDPGCPRSYEHARYLVRHVMDVHPHLTPVTVRPR